MSTVVSVSNFLIVSAIGWRISNTTADFFLLTPLEGIVSTALMFPSVLLLAVFDRVNIHVLVLLNSLLWGAAAYFMLGIVKKAS